MPTPLERLIQRHSSYAAEVITPAITRDPQPLAVSIHACPEAIPLADAEAARFTPITLPHPWGPAWSTAWFRLEGKVPATWADASVALRFACGTEAVLWRDGVPTQGFDDNRDVHRLAAGVTGPVTFLIEAACNRPLGTTAWWWDPPLTKERWASATPGCVDRAEVVRYDETVWRVATRFEMTLRLLELLPVDAPRAALLADGLGRAQRAIDDTDVAGTAAAALAILDEALSMPPPAARTHCIAAGHAHIDTAWLWPIRETRRKCLRTFASVLRLMERFDDFRFVASQAQQYAWVETDAPALFAEIAQRVQEGRWEAGGAMWIEPDANVPSGESLLRQIIHGTRYWRDRFGDAGRQRHLYLPDTFGFSAILPQIMTHGGLDTFITNKIAWNERNQFPNATFRWRGLDGTDVLAHCTPGHDYNATNTPRELRRGGANAVTLASGRPSPWLQPFGYGDGGGGPTDAMIERARVAAAAEGLPAVELGTVRQFCEVLHAHDAGPGGWPVWDGELYLELHRGTYTTHARLKQANRHAEIGLRRVEWLTWWGPGPVGDPGAASGQLDHAWKLVLLNQFHDILPGSSITPVYDDAHRHHAEVAEMVQTRAAIGEAAWTVALGTGSARDPLAVFNPTSVARHEVVATSQGLTWVDDVPALGVRVVDAAANVAPPTPVEVSDHRLANEHFSVEIDDAGRIARFARRGDDRVANAGDERGGCVPLNQLVLYEDRPRAWEAWDIEETYREKAWPVETPLTRRVVVDDAPWRAAIEVERPLGVSSRITQRYVVTAGSPRLDIVTEVEWHESRRLLRSLFPLDVRAREATYDVSFGHVTRPTHRNTSWDQARFEVCAHRWADLSEPGFGVALLNDGKYGHSADGHVLGLSLLRSTRFPDPDADIGRHVFTYALMLHDGDWRKAGVDRVANALNEPLTTRPFTSSLKDGPTSWAPFRLSASSPHGVVVAAVTRQEDDAGRLVRLVETHGARTPLTVTWTTPLRKVVAIDALGQAVATPTIDHDGLNTSVVLRPFQIVTLLVT